MIIDLFSKRQKKARGEVPDVYQYSEIPTPLRIQIVHIIESATNVQKYDNRGAKGAFDFVVKTLCREYGVFKLADDSQGSYSQTANYFLNVKDTEKALDVIELCFRVIDKLVRDRPHEYASPSQNPDDAIDELNHRFREHGVGFQFEQGAIIRLDSELLHADVVRPLLAAMTAKPYIPALSEFHSAHEHYRHKRYKECLNDCLKAFESTMKAICAKRGWPVDSTATAKTLVQTLFDNSFFPAYLQTQMSALRTLLESGTPTIRNKNSGHGQGITITNVPEELASYCIHLTATNLLFIVSRA
jgi:hypothetical protein